MSWTVVLEKSLEDPLDYKVIPPANPEGNQFTVFIGRTDAEAATLILWPPDAYNCLIGKDPCSGKDWRQEEKGTTEDVMFGWHHWLNWLEFKQSLGVGDGQGRLAYCTQLGCKEDDMTEWLNWIKFLSVLWMKSSTSIKAGRIANIVMAVVLLSRQKGSCKGNKSD